MLPCGKFGVEVKTADRERLAVASERAIFSPLKGSPNARFSPRSCPFFAACTSGESNGQTGGVAQGAPNTDFPPAFENQTRAPEVRAQTSRSTSRLHKGLDHPLGHRVLPDGRMHLSPSARGLRIVTREGRISAPITGLREVRAHGQGARLTSSSVPSFANDRMIYWSYVELRSDGSGQQQSHVVG